MTEPIAMFDASVSNVKTMADGSPRFTFDAGEPAIDLLSKLAKAQIEGVYLTILVYDKDTLERDILDTKRNL